MDRVKKRRLRRGIATVAAVVLGGFLLFKTCSKPKTEGPMKLAPVAAKAAKRSRSKIDMERRKRMMRKLILRLNPDMFKIKREWDPAFDFGKVDLDMTDACARLPNTKRDVQKFLYDKDESYPEWLYPDDHQLIDPYMLHAMRTAIRQFGKKAYESHDPNGNDNLLPLTGEWLMKTVEGAQSLMDEWRKSDMLFWLDPKSERDFQAYLVAHNMFHSLNMTQLKDMPGFWVDKDAQQSGHCYSDTMTCLVTRFSHMAKVTSFYCGSGEGREDKGRCKDGKPRKEPPGACYGYTDFMAYVRDCAMHYFPDHIKADFGADVMAIYYRLRNECLE